jgi:hypothetical protein
VIRETRERFIKSIAERLAPERIVEAYFFQSIRQGHMESGIAVIAAIPEVPPPAADVASEDDADVPELPLEAASAEPADDAPEAAEAAAPSDEPLRAEVFTATYRWTRKGPERGKWVVDVVAEAHAPIPTIEAVVRGVQERAGDGLDAIRMSGDEVRQTLPAPEPVAGETPTESAA